MFRFFVVCGLKLASDLGVSVLVVWDLGRFVSLESFWDRELRDHVDDPFLSGCMMDLHWKLGQRVGFHPFMLVFLREGRIVGFAPLILRSRFNSRIVSNFDQYTCPDFFVDEYREVCVGKMVDFLFDRLKCVSVDLTFEDASTNQRMLEKVFKKRGLKFSRMPQEGQAIIPVNSSLDVFKGSLSGNTRNKFKRIGKKLDGLGSWKISCYDVDQNSIEKVWVVEKFSWKNVLQGKKKAIKDWGIEFALRGAQRGRSGEGFFDSELWFLEVNDIPIAYVLVLKHNQIVFLAKTSFDQRFRVVSPGVFLMNDVIEKVFQERSAKKINFFTNLSFVKIWKPIVKKRVTIKIEKKSFLSNILVLVFDNRFSSRFLKFVEQLKWRKKVGS